jgi:hypothetical protein
LLCTDGTGPSTGATFGTFETGDSVADQFGARVMRYLGHATWVAVQGDEIFRSTDAGVSWASVFGPDADLGTTVTKSSLMLTYPNGIATLVILGYDGAGGYTSLSSTDGVTWSKGAKSALTAQTMALQGTTLWQQSLYCTAGFGGSARTYRVLLDSMNVQQITQPDMHGTQNDSAFCVFNDRFFGVWTRASTGTVGLFELLSGEWVARVTVGGTTTVFKPDRKISLFVQGSDMFSIFTEDNPAFPGDPNPLLFVCREIDSSLTVTDRPTPVALIHGGETDFSRIAALTDGPSGGSGSVPSVYIYFAPDGLAATGVDVRLWNGPLASISGPLGGGNSTQNSWPLGVQYGGNVFWSSGQRVVEKIKSEPVESAVRWTFRLYSPFASVDDQSVRAFQGVATDEWPSGPLGPNSNPVLANPSAGVLVGQTITGLDAADNGATDFTVDWLAPTNGGFPFLLGEYAKTVLEVF